jgi:hypothetical protein
MQKYRRDLRVIHGKSDVTATKERRKHIIENTNSTGDFASKMRFRERTLPAINKERITHHPRRPYASTSVSSQTF